MVLAFDDNNDDKGERGFLVCVVAFLGGFNGPFLICADLVLGGFKGAFLVCTNSVLGVQGG